MFQHILRFNLPVNINNLLWELSQNLYPYPESYFDPVILMMRKKMHIFIIFIAFVLISLSGCAQLEKRGPAIPDVSMFELYVSDINGTKLNDPVFARGDTVYFTLAYKDMENFKPLEASNIQYEFSKLSPVGLDVHEGFPVDELKFINSSGSNIVILNPGDSAIIGLTVPRTDEKWDNIINETDANQSVAFDLVIKIKDLKVPLNSNKLTVKV